LALKLTYRATVCPYIPSFSCLKIANKCVDKNQGPTGSEDFVASITACCKRLIIAIGTELKSEIRT
jgi:hypothetical protein